MNTVFFLSALLIFPGTSATQEREPSGEIISLPAPVLAGSLSVEEALWKRRTVRSYSAEALTLAQLGQLCWAAQGINRPPDHRTAPSAGAFYPLELYIVVGDSGVTGLAAGVYKYLTIGHSLSLVRSGDKRSELRTAGYTQSFFATSPVTLVLTGVYSRTTGKYGDRGIRYVHMEAGHAAQNVLLQAAGLGLNVGIAGAFRDEVLKKVVSAAADETPLYLLPVGH